MLRRALLVWGWGHIHLGDRRGWILVILQPIAILALVFVAVQLIDGTRWLVVFPPLAALIVVWLAQALHAHARAIELGAERGGEFQAALFLPVAVAVLSIFWLLGGRHGSPAATLESYAIAWMTNRPDVATALYETPPSYTQLDESWDAQFAYLAGRVATLAEQYGPQSGLDPGSPFDNLRFTDPAAASSNHQVVGIEIVRRQRVENTILGIVPTATQETVVVERAGTITLSLVPEPPNTWLPFGRLDSQAWRIQSVQIGAP